MKMKNVFAAVAALLMAVCLTGCEVELKESPLEESAETVNETMESAGESVEEMSEDAQEAVENE